MQLRLALFFAISVAACAGAPVSPRGGAPERLDFSLPDTTGKTIRRADFNGRVVLVDLWATWCKPCEASMPFYAELQERYAGQGFAVVAVSVDERDEDVRAFLERRPFPFTILRDPEGKVPAMLDFAIETMPTAVLLDREGRIVHVHTGFVDRDREEIEAKVRATLGDAS